MLQQHDIRVWEIAWFPIGVDQCTGEMASTTMSQCLFSGPRREGVSKISIQPFRRLQPTVNSLSFRREHPIFGFLAVNLGSGSTAVLAYVRHPQQRTLARQYPVHRSCPDVD